MVTHTIQQFFEELELGFPIDSSEKAKFARIVQQLCPNGFCCRCGSFPGVGAHFCMHDFGIEWLLHECFSAQELHSMNEKASKFWNEAGMAEEVVSVQQSERPTSLDGQ